MTWHLPPESRAQRKTAETSVDPGALKHVRFQKCPCLCLVRFGAVSRQAMSLRTKRLAFYAARISGGVNGYWVARAGPVTVPFWSRCHFLEHLTDRCLS